jgi:hypothetical protein
MVLPFLRGNPAIRLDREQPGPRFRGAIPLMLVIGAMTALVPATSLAVNTNTGIVRDCSGNPLPNALVYIAAEVVTGDCSN